MVTADGAKLAAGTAFWIVEDRRVQELGVVTHPTHTYALVPIYGAFTEEYYRRSYPVWPCLTDTSHIFASRLRAEEYARREDEIYRQRGLLAGEYGIRVRQVRRDEYLEQLATRRADEALVREAVYQAKIPVEAGEPGVQGRT